MKRKITLVVLCMHTISVYAQITFEKTYGGTGTDVGFSVQQTNDGGYIIAGYTTSFGAGGKDVYLIKTNNFGDTLWTKTFGGNLDDIAYSVQQTNDGGYIVGGITNSFGSTNNRIYLIKTSGNGSMIWSKVHQLAYSDTAYCVSQTSDGGYIVSGVNSHDFPSLLKVNSNGNLVWAKEFDFGLAGGFFRAYSAQETTDGGYIVTGNGKILFSDIEKLYLLKADANGNFVWAESISQTLNYHEGGCSVIQSIDGGYVVTGYTHPTANYRIYLVKTDINGNLSWSKDFVNNVPYVNTSGYTIQQTVDHGYIMLGSTLSQLIKTDSNGTFQWSKMYGVTYSSTGYSGRQTSDGGYIIAGTINSDVYLIKTDNNGISNCNDSTPVEYGETITSHVTNLSGSANSNGIGTISDSATIRSGGIVTTLCFSVGISEAGSAENYFTFFPNPATTEVTLNFGKAGRYVVGVCNTLGEVLEQTQTNSATLTLNMSNKPKGIYFIKVTEEAGNKAVRKIVKM